MKLPDYSKQHPNNETTIHSRGVIMVIEEKINKKKISENKRRTNIPLIAEKKMITTTKVNVDGRRGYLPGITSSGINDEGRILSETKGGDINTRQLSMLGYLVVVLGIVILSSVFTLAIVGYLFSSSSIKYDQHVNNRNSDGKDDLVMSQKERSIPTSSSHIFNLFEDCSYERILANGITESVPITNDNLPLIKDVPFGFGCRVVKMPSRIQAIPFGTQFMSERNTDIFSPIKPSNVQVDICANYSNVSCMDYFCYSNSSLGSVEQRKYELFNYCKYCKNNRQDFLDFQYKIYYREDAVVNQTKNMECPSFVSFPSAFYCGSIQTGLPLFFFDKFYQRLRNPFFCYCHEVSKFNVRCDASLFTTGFDFGKTVISILFSTCLSLGALFTYVIPQIRQVSRVRKIGILNTCSILTVSAAASSVTVSSIMYAIAYLGESENLTLSNLALSLNVFFTYYSMLPVMLTFDRIYNYLNSGEKRNCPKFKVMILAAFIILTLSAAYVTSSYILEFAGMDTSILIITVSMGYIAFAIPWLDNLVLFFFLSYRLRKALRSKTNVPFFKTKYFYQFFALNTLSVIALFSCLSAFIARQLGRDSSTYQFSYYVEQVSQFANYSTLLIMLVILYDAQLFVDCYKPILQLFKLFDSRKNNNQLKDSLLNDEYTPGEIENDSVPVSNPTTTTNTSEQTKNSSYYVPPSPNSFVSEF